MSKPSLLAEFWTFLKAHKWWWLAPLLVTLLLILFLIATAEDSPLAPFIYSLS